MLLCFNLGTNLEQFLQSAPDAQGIDTASSGYQIAIELNQNPVTFTSSGTTLGTFTSAPANALVVLHFTRILVLKGGALEILD